MPTLGTNSFWRRAALTAAGLVALAVLGRAADRIYSLPHGHFLGYLISVARSRETLDNPGVNGYYERLLAKGGTMEGNYIFDHSFRVFRFRPNLTWEHDLVITNSFGMVGPEISLSKPPHTRRAALLGGSLSSGHMIHPDQTFAALLEDRLNADHPSGTSGRFEILNFACIAYTLPQELDAALEDTPRFDPDVYLLDVNELSVFRQWDRQLVQVAQLGVDPKYDYLRKVFLEAHLSPKDDEQTLYGKLTPYRMTVVRETLQRFKAFAAQRRAPLIAILVPSIEEGDLSKRRMEGIPELLESMDIDYIDLLDTFEGILDTAPLAAYRGDVHPNARGHRMLFENLYAKLKAQPRAWAALTGEEISVP